jgi:FemAB-related protein (PEP-CTERM system-associated)
MSVQVELFRGSARAWDDFVVQQPAGCVSHVHAWKTVIGRVYGHDCPYLAAQEDGNLVGVLPLVDVRSLAFGRYLVSMPFLNGGGPLGSKDAIDALTSAALAMARGRRARLAEFRCRTPMPTQLQCSIEKVASVLTLPNQVDELWGKLGGKLRAQVRRPLKEGIEVRFGADQVVPFFTVFARCMRDLGSPTHPLHFFRSISSELQDRVWFACAYLRDKPVAAGCALHWKQELEITWAAALREYNPLAPNMLLYWSFLERAIQAGLRSFDFGRSTPGSGTHRFKQQWGARDLPLYWFRETRRAGNSTPNKDQGSFSLATRVWRHVPVPLATLIGARLRGGIPA